MDCIPTSRPPTARLTQSVPGHQQAIRVNAKSLGCPKYSATLNMPRPSESGRLLFAIAVLPVAVVLGGCGGPPQALAPVKGKVTYSDGSLIETRTIVTFIPQGITDRDGLPARAAQATANEKDGTFVLTTWKYADGSAIGKHKVTIVALKATGGYAVSTKYASEATTPIPVVEVVADKPNYFHIKIEKGR